MKECTTALPGTPTARRPAQAAAQKPMGFPDSSKSGNSHPFGVVVGLSRVNPAPSWMLLPSPWLGLCKSPKEAEEQMVLSPLSIPFQGQQEAMLWALVLLPIFLAPASQISFNSKGRTLSVTKQNGSIAEITCDIVDQSINYIHWYRYQVGKAPHRLLYFGFTGSKVVLETGITSGKYYVLEGSGRTCILIVRNVQQSDAGVYYCAAWDTHSCQAAVTLEQPRVVLGRTGSSALLPCMIRTKVRYIHWYRHQEGEAPERLLWQATFKSDVRWDSVVKADKVRAKPSSDGSSCTLSVLKLQKADEGTYYCAAWDTHSLAPRCGCCSKSSGFPNLCMLASQISFNSKLKPTSVTKWKGSVAEITCDIVDRTINYIHWYRYQEGKAPHRLLYFGFTGSKVVHEAGITSGKYHAYEGPGRTCKLTFQNVQQSDAGCQGAVKLEQPQVVLGRVGSSAVLPCTVRTKVSYIHWYRHQEGKAPERVLRLTTSNSDVRWDPVLKADKVRAMQSSDGSSCSLSVLRLQKGDEGMYYCAAWDPHSPKFTGYSPFLLTVGLGLSKVEQSKISISTAAKKSTDIYCKVWSTDFENEVIHWYREKPNQALEHLLYVSSTKDPVRKQLGGKDNKVEARKYSPISTSILTINSIEKEDMATYYCAGWSPQTSLSHLLPGSQPASQQDASPGSCHLLFPLDFFPPSSNSTGDTKKILYYCLCVNQLFMGISFLCLQLLEQPEMLVSKIKDKSSHISCKVYASNFNDVNIYWYCQKPNQNIKHLMYVVSTTKPVQQKIGWRIKFEASKDSRTSTSTLKINFLEKEDEATYYCACWTHIIKIAKITFTKTNFRSLPTHILPNIDRNLDTDLSPKPTVFLPSIAEIDLHKAGTYICLLENFFPDIIKIDWNEKNDDTILESQEGNTTETGDTYMKFSWLTVPEMSMDKDHVCVVKHKFNRGGFDQKITFPSIKKVKEYFSNTYTETTTMGGDLTPRGKEDEHTTHIESKKLTAALFLGPLQLQFTHISAYYTYVLLLLKSKVYLAIIAFSLCRRPGTPEPAPPSHHWPETSCSQGPHFLTFSLGASQPTGCLSWKLSSSLLSGLVIGTGQLKLEQPEISISNIRYKTAHVSCKVTSDRSLEEDFSPKHTIFFPSVAELALHKNGTYIFLLENFPPDVIKIDWKEKDSDKILSSHQGNTTKIGNTYINFSWLTVPETSKDKDHVCVVKHSSNKGEDDQEIILPSIVKVAVHPDFCHLHLHPPPTQEHALLWHHRFQSAQETRNLRQGEEFLTDVAQSSQVFQHHESQEATEHLMSVAHYEEASKLSEPLPLRQQTGPTLRPTDRDLPFLPSTWEPASRQDAAPGSSHLLSALGFWHWTVKKPDQNIEQLINTVSTIILSQQQIGGSKKFEAGKNSLTFTLKLRINYLEKEDEAMYYCACWMHNTKITMVTYTKTNIRSFYPRPSQYGSTQILTPGHPAWVSILHKKFSVYLVHLYERECGMELTPSLPGGEEDLRDYYRPVSPLYFAQSLHAVEFGPETSCSQGPHFLTFSLGASQPTICLSWKLSSSLLSGLETLKILYCCMSFDHENFTSLFAVVIGELKLEQPRISISKGIYESAHISCKAFSGKFNTLAQKQVEGKKKFEASKDSRTSTSTLKIYYLENKDEGTYYWACWDHTIKTTKITYTKINSRRMFFYYSYALPASPSPVLLPLYAQCPSQDPSDFCRSCNQCGSTVWSKLFGEGTKLIVIPPGCSKIQNACVSPVVLFNCYSISPTDRNLDANLLPKPTVFLPSIAEIDLHKAGTYICLLENFFPDVIKIDWKEKDGNTIIESQEGNSTGTGDTYMKFSWLTVPERSADKDHVCVVKHEFNREGKDQEILFPSIKKELMTGFFLGLLQLQLTNTSSVYTYVFLLLKSMVYFVIISFSLCRRAGGCYNGKNLLLTENSVFHSVSESQPVNMMPLLEAVIFSSLWAFKIGATKNIDFQDKILEHLLYVISTTKFTEHKIDGKTKLEASKGSHASTSTLKIIYLEKEDEATRRFCIPVYHLIASLFAVGVGQLKLEQPKISISRLRYQTVQIHCKVSSRNFNRDYIHWYQHKPGQNIEHLMYVQSTTKTIQKKIGGNIKLEASKNPYTSISTLKINYFEKEDEATYYCAIWDHNIKTAKISYTKINFRCVPTHIVPYMGTTEASCLGSHPDSPSCRIYYCGDETLRRYSISIYHLFTLFAVGVGQLNLEQPKMSISRPKYQIIQIHCKVSSRNFNSDYIHWYKQKIGQNIEHLMYVRSTTEPTQKKIGENIKLEAIKDLRTSTSNLIIYDFEKEDEATYYCAIWDHNIKTAKISYTKINFRSVPTHILPYMGTTEASHLACSTLPSSPSVSAGEPESVAMEELLTDGGVGQFNLEQPMSVSRLRHQSVQIHCKVSFGSFNSDYIHWYKHKPGQNIEHLLYVRSSTEPTQKKIGGVGQLKLEQPMSVSIVRYQTVQIHCKVSSGKFNSDYIHWYKHKPGQNIEHLLYVRSSTEPTQKKIGYKIKLEASKNPHTFTSILKINYFEKEDEATYYWPLHHQQTHISAIYTYRFLLLKSMVYFAIITFILCRRAGLKLEQPKMSVSRRKYRTAYISCKVFSSYFNNDYIHWYKHKPGQNIEHLMYVQSTMESAKKKIGNKVKFEASKDAQTSTSTLKINDLEDEDAATYYCAIWDHSIETANKTYTKNQLQVFSSYFNNDYIHWYKHKPGQNIEHLMYVQSTMESAKKKIGNKVKFEASKDAQTSTSTLKINDLEDEDAATYYCAIWDHSIETANKTYTKNQLQVCAHPHPSNMGTTKASHLSTYFCRSCNQCDRTNWIKIFGEGTKLIIIPPERKIGTEFSPKPTVFLPSVAETKRHTTGTYVCLLENFYPDVIKIDWKEKNGKTILESQQGPSISTDDTFMKFSWLTVPKTSIDKDYVCVVKHEFNKGGVDQEILFPSIKKGPLQLQFTYISAYYTYIFLILKSMLYFAIISFSLFRTGLDSGDFYCATWGRHSDSVFPLTALKSCLCLQRAAIVHRLNRPSLTSCPNFTPASQPANRMPLLEAVIFSSLWAHITLLFAVGVGQLKLEQPKISISKTRAKTAHIPCKVTSNNFDKEFIHWYRHKPDQNIEHLIMVSTKNSVEKKVDGKTKLEAEKISSSSMSTLKINALEEEDEAMYYCAVWDHSNRIAKITFTKTNYRLGDNLTQLKISITKRKGSTAFLECPIKTSIFKQNAYVHWYRQKPEQPLQRILFISSNENVVHEHGISEERYEAKKRHTNLPVSLRIHQVSESDAGLYFCACWDTQCEHGDTKMRLSQDQLTFTRKTNKTVHISCKLSGVPLENTTVHWYQQKEGEPLTWILYGSGKNFKQDKPNSRLETVWKNGRVFYLIINNVIKSDEATYYCACWDPTVSQTWEGPVRKPSLSCNQCDKTGWIKIFGEGTKLIVIPSEKNLDGDFTPKPTVFLPSAAEIDKHKAGTYICLLENFFPDVIKIDWKEKDGDRILESQEGNTTDTGDTYMKFSWLTVPERSMAKDHVCVVKHEFIKTDDQEILFPSIKKGTLQAQFAHTSAYYTYIFLLLKSMVYFAIITFSLFRRTGDCGNGICL
ncbi:LOW QUALITY PROTEIN: T-cell receptor gamma chain C region DFL12 [Galemys pyrenaicus]|nr:LOW QUALITY PROTEIN: T-cell receptor gamma chain C region DFL12 [Galemys pyrenaicus]